MRSLLIVVAGAVSITVLGNAALAQSSNIGTAYNWTGMYAGLDGGFGSGSTTPFNNFGITVPAFNMTGAFGGAQVGVNWQAAGSLVFGAEADIQGSAVNGSYTVPICAITCKTCIDWLGTLRGRFGY